MIGAMTEKPKTRPKLVDVIADIKRLSVTLSIDPWKITVRDYYGNGGSYTEWQLRKLGGLPAIVKDAFPAEVAREITEYQGESRRRQYVAKLERELGDWQYWTDNFKSAIRSILKENPIQVSAPRKWPARKTANLERETVCHISDTHFGINVDSEEVEGSIYNWEVSARRFGYLAQTVADYKLDHRKECQRLVLNFCGDIVHGIIHADDYNADLLAMQLVGAARYMIAFIDYELNFYEKILVPTTSDNHARVYTPVKGKSRAMAQKYDSFNTVMFEMVQQAFRNNPNVQFLIPKTPYTIYKVFGYPFWTTHGDTVIKIGNPSKTIDIGKIVGKIDAINSVLDESKRMQVLLTGHVHTGLYLGLDSGVDLFINPSMSGIDPYAQAIGNIRPSRPGQWLFEVSKEHRVGDKRLVWLASADNDKSYEEIIPPFQYELGLKKLES